MDDTSTTELIKSLPQIITSLAALVGAVGGVWIGLLGYRKSKQNANAIENVRKEVNGQSEQLLKVTDEAAFARGIKDEKDRQ